MSSFILSINTYFSFFLSYYLQGFIECLCTHLKKLSEIVKTCIEEIAEWRHLQQRSLCGFLCPPSLDKLQEVYVHLNKNFASTNPFFFYSVMHVVCTLCTLSCYLSCPLYHLQLWNTRRAALETISAGFTG